MNDSLRVAQLAGTGRLALACSFELHRLLGAAAGTVAQLAPDAQPGALGELREVLARAGELNRQLMAVGQRPHGDLALIDLGELVDAMRPLLALLAGPTAFVVPVRNDGDVRVLAGRGALELILLNLIGASAVQRRITVSSGLTAWRGGPTANGGDLPAGTYACLSVCDERLVPPPPTAVCPHCHGAESVGLPLVAALAAELGGGLVLEPAITCAMEQHVLLPAIA